MYLTLDAYLRRQVAAQAEQTAIINVVGAAVQRLSYGQLYEQSRRVAAWLLAQGWGRQARGMIIMENRPEWPLSYFGLLLAGGTAVPVDVQSRPEHLAYVLEQTQARVVFASAQAPLAAIARAPAVPQVVWAGPPPPCGLPGVPFAELLQTPPPDVLPQVGLDDLASIIYTSGTTGLPKGVMLTQKNFAANYEGIAALRAVTPADNFLALLPLFHAFPFTATLLLPLFTGATVTFLDTLKAEPVLRCLKEQRVTILPVTPQVLQHFYRGLAARLEQLPLGLGRLLPRALELARRWHEQGGPDLGAPLTRRFRQALGEQFRFFVSGGAKLPEELAENFGRLGFTVLEGYGLTETAPVVTINPPEAPRLGSAGKPLVNVEVRIDNPNGQGVGEILIRGDNVMAGYFQNEDATKAVIQDGWFHSGDLGRFDADGYLFVQGRIKDIIVLSSGKNISAAEVAQPDLQAPAIKEIFILPDARQEKLAAVIFPNFDYFRQTGETDVSSRVKWYLDYYSQQLEPYKRVRDFVLTNQELPKTRLGKIRMQEAAKIYQERAGKPYQAKKSALQEDLSAIGREVVRLLLAKSGQPLIALDDHLELDLGLDSLALVELAAALEERLQVAIKETSFADLFTVGELVRFVEGLQPGSGEPAGALQPSWTAILQQDPSETLRRRIELGKSLGASLFTWACSLKFGLVAKAFFHLQVRGQETLPPGAALICPNHTSYLDGFLIFLVTPHRRRQNLFFLGSTYYFDLPLIRPLVKALRVIPVDSARHLVEAMQAAAYVLRHGKLLCVFPEGARSITGELREIKKGVVILARELKVPIVPAFIQGSYEAWGPLQTWPRPHQITVTFGRPHSYAKLLAAGRRQQPEAGEEEAAALGLRQAMAVLQGKGSRDEV
ncbi:MAG: AMP-binding protein [Desulfobacca sp.]|uniref:AMP-binding protein n=1 Tax=Desulfobacca sp. TaxID=2067990 RepID=UPI004048F82C